MDLEAMKTEWDNMRRGIDAQPALLETEVAGLYERAVASLGDTAPSRVYLAGCGDSFYTGLAARYGIEAWSGLGAEALESLEFSRYAIRSAPEDALLVGVSNSGEVARSVEAVTFARQKGMRTVGLTYKPQSRLAQAAEHTFQYVYDDMGFGPGTLSYTACTLALLVAGVRLGELTGRIEAPERDQRLADFAELAIGMKATIDASEEVAQELAATFQHDDRWYFLGAGPNLGTAHFAMAKMIESVRHNSVAQGLEEWAHEQYFCCEPGTTTVVFSPPGASLDRAREQLWAIRQVGGTAVAVCAHDDEETTALADVVFPVYGEPDELVSPLLYAVSVQLLAYHCGVNSGRTMLGFDDKHRKSVNMQQILRSEIPTELPALGGA